MWKKFKALGSNAQDLIAAIAITVVGVSLGLLLSACTQQPAPEVVQAAPVVSAPVAAAPAQAQPVVVVQQPAAAQSNGVGDFMMGALVGHALSGGGGGGGYGYHPAPVVHQTTVVNKTVNVTKVQPRAYVSPRMPAPARSFSGGRRR